MLAYKCSTQKPIRAGKVHFGLLSNEEIERMSTCHIKDTTIYYRGLPNPNGINDHRMGTVDRRLLCGTCCKDVRHCQGHIGHIKLSYPMYHIGFFDTTFKCLRCVCFSCSKLLLNEEEKKSYAQDLGKTQFNNIYNTIKNRKKCMHCGFTQPNYIRGSLFIKTEWPNDMEWESEDEKKLCQQIFTQKDALSILQHISDEDCFILGLNPVLCHPKHTVLKTILVPPPVARPAIMASEGSRSRGQDDLTHKLQDIIKKSNDVANYMQEKHYSNVTTTPELMERLNKLQFEVFTYMNNNIRGQKQSTQRSGAPTKSLTDRLKGKDGRIRGNLMGKRVDFSARSVITPDAVMDIDQVGIPYKIATSLTIPERVTGINIKKLTERVIVGADNINGAESVITSNGVMIHLTHCENRDKIRLQYGWIVERYLQDDDIVIFNRQPSLHKMGMMGHRVKLMQGSTFRLNLCCANPYNADFDGDEMNLHVPQSPAACADVAMLMMVGRQVISPQANKPVMGIVQDTLLGAHLFSKDDVFLDRRLVCHLIAGLKYKKPTIPPACIQHPKELWSGKQLLSFILPNTMSLGLEFESSDIASHKKCFVRNGNIMTGIMNKSLLGTSAGGFVDVLFREYGSVIVILWMSEIQRLVNAWLIIRGFSVSIRDCVLTEKGEERVKERVTTAMRYAEELLKEPVEKGSPEASVLESTIVRILSKTLMQTGGIVDEELGNDNAIRNMVNAGSKGNPINLSQICGCVGQQSVEGHRVFPEKGGRTLTCFDYIDNSLAGQGFVQNSYALGLHPHEYFFHAMGGREGLVDTAVKTATTGYIQRRQIKSMEDHKVYYDGTVRSADESIIDFSYGGDCMDAARVERIRLNLLKESIESIKERMTDWEAECAILNKELILQCKISLLTELDTRILMPFNPYRMHLKHLKGTSATFEEIESIVKNMVLRKKSAIYRACILDFFCTSKIYNAKLSVEEINAIFDNIETKWMNSRVNYGEMVGSIAAQSIGEPCTQMSVPHGCMVLSKQDGIIQNKSIGEIIDSYLPNVTSSNQHDVIDIHNLQCVGVTPTENASWANVTHVSRHPANGDMITITTEHGRVVRATASHSFLTRSKNRIIPTIGSDLVIGDCIPIVKNLPTSMDTNITSPFKLTAILGRFVGAILSEGHVNNNSMSFSNTQKNWAEEIGQDFQRETGLNVGFAYRKMHELSLGNGYLMHITVNNREFAAWISEHFGRTSFNKTLPAWILDAPEDFVTGLLQTYFDGDGNVQTEKRHHRLCCHSVSSELITMLSLCLARFGIPTYVGKEDYKTPAGNPGMINRITIPMCFAARFQEVIGFSIDYKVERLKYVVKEQEKKTMRGFQAYIPGMNEVLEEIREYIPRGGNKNSFETLLRKEFRRIQRKPGITPKMLMRCREHAVKFNAPDYLLEELDYAINADVWWDPIVSIEIEKDSKEMVYDFTVDQNLQSFMLSNGVFVHNTLNTFHFAGVISKNVTLGIPRLKELLDQAKQIKTPCNTIRFVPSLSKNKEFAKFIADTLPLTRLGDIVSSCDFVYDPNDECPGSSESDKFMVDMNTLIGCDPSPTCSNYVIRLLLNQSLMKTRRITPPIVRTLLRNRLCGKAHIISSETNDVDWVIRIRLEEMKTMLEKLEQPEREREREGLLCHRVISVLLDTVAICGHVDIQAAFTRPLEMNDDEHFVVDTQGCNLIDLSSVPCIDWYNTTSNDVNEIHNVLGIEAAGAILYHELTVTISFDGTYVDPRHIMMIVNTMIRGGYIMPLSRHGINRMDTGPLLRCSFEETPDILCDAASYGEVDNGKGVSQNIMTGKLAHIGTGFSELMMNPSMMHPRAIQLEAKIGKKVLKSKIRVRPLIPTQVELVRITSEDQQQIQQKMQLPFDNTVQNDSDMMEDTIYAATEVEAPFTDDKTSTQNFESQKNTQMYRPSTPTFDFE
jgi:DNA-directed RNA polymerase beta' subunit